jgi:hypothetical protein
MGFQSPNVPRGNTDEGTHVAGGNFNVSRRPNRKDETFHRDKRRRGVDRLGMLEGHRRRPSALRVFFSALGGLLRRR